MTIDYGEEIFSKGGRTRVSECYRISSRRRQAPRAVLWKSKKFRNKRPGHHVANKGISVRMVLIVPPLSSHNRLGEMPSMGFLPSSNSMEHLLLRFYFFCILMLCANRPRDEDEGGGGRGRLLSPPTSIGDLVSLILKCSSFVFQRLHVPYIKLILSTV